MTKRKERSFSIKIALLIIAVVFILLLVFFIFIRMYIISIQEQEYNERVTSANALISKQIDGDRIDRYAMSLIKDDGYYLLVDDLYDLKSAFNIDSLYIISKRGRNDYYTIVFNALLDEEKNTYDESDFGKRIHKDEIANAVKVMESGESYIDADYIVRDGKPLYYTYSAIVNSKGNVVGILGTTVDATAMRQEISRIQRNFAVFCLITFIIIFAYVIICCQYFISKPILKMTADIEDIAQGNLDIKFSQKIHGRNDELGAIYKAFYQVTQTIQSLVNDLNQVTKEVARGNLNSRIKNKKLYCGRYTDIKDNANKMLDNNSRLLDMTPNAIIFFDNEYNLIYHNHPAAYDYETESNDLRIESDDNYIMEVLNQNCQSLNKIFHDFLKQDENTYTGTTMLEDENEQKHYFNSFFIKIYDGSESPGICAVFTDVTQYVEISERAQAANRAKSEFLSRMSHEIRTPMNAILGVSQLMRRLTLDEQAVKHLDTIQMASDHLLSVINDILDMAKIDSGNIELEKRSFSLEHLIDDVYQLLNKAAEQKNIRLVIDRRIRTVPLPAVTGDEVRLRQILINLVSNAIKFSADDNQVIMKMWEKDCLKEQMVSFWFAVQDFGIGIQPEAQKKIFEAFSQAGSHISREYGGTGLGLAISHQLVRLMGGEGILVDSVPGEGSEFCFTLCFETVRDGTEQTIRNKVDDCLLQPEPFKQKRALLVDDVEINREIILALLEDSGLQIECADDGTTALEAFENSVVGYYDIILMDIQMKTMDGYTAAKKIRETSRPDGKTVKIIAMSAHAFQEEIDRAMVSGMDDYITKPVEYEVLMHALSKALS